MASLSRARGNLEIICSCDDYKSGTIKLASGTGLRNRKGAARSAKRGGAGGAHCRA